ncbi:hypothetical protein Y032_0355g3317 [Ancylostoma ceylanicum]|nr:hypothetical protein Y032_0355g3317 [Ancylostoma ceylanicum]
MTLSRVVVPLARATNRLLPHSAVFSSKPAPEVAHKLKVTIIPGDGVGPELIYTVQDIVKNTGIPLDFEEIFLSEVHYTRSASIENAVKSIARNNNVALKGAIQESAVLHTEGELSGLNMRLRRALDLFANVVHIKGCYAVNVEDFDSGNVEDFDSGRQSCGTSSAKWPIRWCVVLCAFFLTRL